MDFTLLSSMVTVVSFVCFVGIWLWAFSRSNKARFEQLACIALDEDEPALAGKDEIDKANTGKNRQTRANEKRV